ncbi:MAG TPA: hypothetical protein VIX19_13890 [Terriglobales bacterium]
MPELTATKRPIQTRSRTLQALLVAGKGLAISFAKTLYALWLEVTGLLFGVLAVGGASALVRQYRTDHFTDHRRLVGVSAFTLVCTYFTVVSFVRAKRTRKR